MRRQFYLVVSFVSLVMMGSFSLPGPTSTGLLNRVALTNVWAVQPAVTISPREMDLGLLSAGKTCRGVITIRNSDSRSRRNLPRRHMLNCKKCRLKQGSCKNRLRFSTHLPV